MCLAIMDAVPPPFPVNDVIDLGKVTSRVPPCPKLSFGFLEFIFPLKIPRFFEYSGDKRACL